MSASQALLNARRALYTIAGGSYDSNDVAVARLTTAQRTEYFRSSAFRDWVAAEKAAGHEVFWLRDVDKTQAAGDVFTFFYHWCCRHNAFAAEGVKAIKKALTAKRRKLPALRRVSGMQPIDVIDLWLRKEAGHEGIGLLELWSQYYWPGQVGWTREEKAGHLKAFAPEYAKRVYPGVPEENRTLEEVGVHVVIVSNGDQELAVAAAPYLGIKPENVVGATLRYGADGKATGVPHSYEVFGEEWGTRPQPGKALNFHFWVHSNRARFGWDFIMDDNIVIAGRDGDSASADGGMMIHCPKAAIGNFMIDTPGEPDRLEALQKLAAKYGWNRGQFITLKQLASELGAKP